MAWSYGGETPGVAPLDLSQYTRYSAEGNAAQWAVKKFNEILGRNPTPSELSQAVPIFQGADPHISDVQAGTAFVASIKNTPSNLIADQNAELLKKAPEHFGDVTSQFQSLLGRAPTQDELNHFGSLLASGTIDPYQLQDFVKQQPEYQQKQVDALSGKLQGYDKQYYQEQIMPAIQANFAKQGRTIDSSGFANSLGQAASMQNIDREKYLAGLSATNMGNAYQNYTDSVNNNMNLRQQSALAPVQRQNQLTDFGIQQNAYNQYLQRYGKRQSNAGAYGSLIGGGIGAIGGAFGGNPLLGYQIGSSLGGAAGNIYGNSGN